MEQDVNLVNNACPFCGGDNSIGEEFRDQEWSGAEYPYWLENGYQSGWDGQYGWQGGYDQRNDYGSKHHMKPMKMPMPMPMPIVKPVEKNYSEFKLLEQKVNITEINNIIIKIEKKHPYMIKRLMMLGIVEAECKKILYLALMCSGKFDL